MLEVVKGAERVLPHSLSFTYLYTSIMEVSHLLVRESSQSNQYVESNLYYPIEMNKSDIVLERIHVLFNILEDEIALYYDLLGRLQDQRKHFSSGDIVALEEINKQLGTIVLKIKTLEEARKAIVSQITSDLNMHQEEITLTKLASIVEDPHKMKLLQLRKKINCVVKELNNVKEGNVYFIQHALRYVSGVLKIFAFDSDEDRYSSDGKLRTEVQKGRFWSGWG